MGLLKGPCIGGVRPQAETIGKSGEPALAAVPAYQTTQPDEFGAEMKPNQAHRFLLLGTEAAAS